MHRSYQLTKKRDAKLENEAQGEPNGKKKRSDDRTTTIATIDNETMVEAFKFFKYDQLAKKSLVSKKYRDLIQTNRHKLALLFVDITFKHYELDDDPGHITRFDSPEEYNEWVDRNGYSKQIPREGQVGGKNSPEYDETLYEISAEAVYKVSNGRRQSYNTKEVFYACAEINNENWPLFQHIVRMLSDPSVCIHWMSLIPQNDVLNLLTDTINPDLRRLQCKQLTYNLEFNDRKIITWIKNNVRCDLFRVSNCSGSNDYNPNYSSFQTMDYCRSKCDREFLDFFMTGANCTSKIDIKRYGHSEAIVGFVQKFLDLKGSDERQLVESIQGNFRGGAQEMLNQDYAEFIVEEDENDNYGKQVFEFVNKDIGKKLRLTLEDHDLSNKIWIKIKNL
ncbi:hypothetical protein Ddc_20301 [Ditylenchus destructor]|nr:hypothetical protein Ddc_20301 [Ditylenchus destructor]